MRSGKKQLLLRQERDHAVDFCDSLTAAMPTWPDLRNSNEPFGQTMAVCVVAVRYGRVLTKHLASLSRRLVSTRRLFLVVTVVSCTTSLIVVLARNPGTTPSENGGAALSATATVSSTHQRENPCNRISDVRVLPADRDIKKDEIYAAFMKGGSRTVLCLIRSMSDTTLMPDPRETVKWPDVTVGDVAFFLLRDWAKRDFVESFPTAMQEELRTSGITAYHRYMKKVENRKALQQNVYGWYQWYYLRPDAPGVLDPPDDPVMPGEVEVASYKLRVENRYGKCSLIYEGPRNGDIPTDLPGPCEFVRHPVTGAGQNFSYPNGASTFTVVLIVGGPLEPGTGDRYMKTGCGTQTQAVSLSPRGVALGAVGNGMVVCPSGGLDEVCFGSLARRR